jgi:hypothetical protein
MRTVCCSSQPAPSSLPVPPTHPPLHFAPCPQRPQPPPPQAEDDAEIYETYTPARVFEGTPHPDVIVETASLASIKPPEAKYNHNLQVSASSGRDAAGRGDAVCGYPRLPRLMLAPVPRITPPQDIVAQPAISNAQLETVIYANQRFQQRLPDGSRAGFFLVRCVRCAAFVVVDGRMRQRHGCAE